jgi:hypothetical protein
LGSPDGISAETTDLGAILSSRHLFVWYTNKYVNELLGTPIGQAMNPVKSPDERLPARSKSL